MPLGNCVYGLLDCYGGVAIDTDMFHAGLKAAAGTCNAWIKKIAIHCYTNDTDTNPEYAASIQQKAVPEPPIVLD